MFLMYILYYVHMLFLIAYILIGIYYAKSFIKKNQIKFGTKGDDIANYIACIIYLINWLILKMFCTEYEK